MMQMLCRWKSEHGCVCYPAWFFNIFVKITFIQQEAGYLTHRILLVGSTFLQDSSRLLAEQLRVHILSSAFKRCLQLLLLVRRIGIVVPDETGNHSSPMCCQWQYPTLDASGKMQETTMCHKGDSSDSHPSELAGALKHVDVALIVIFRSWLTLGVSRQCFRAEQWWKQR